MNETSDEKDVILPVGHSLVDNEHFKTGFRPKIGLALGGGGARGWAHIGVLRALKENGIEPDIIAGTSIGALVGGCYLADTLEDLEIFARSLTRKRVLSLLDFTLGGSGLIGGQKLARLMDEKLSGMAIGALHKPFIAVATELGTGHEIWLRSGSLMRAMRASYALPGIFEPIEIGGRWLTDGALVNPVPVSVCRAMGARVVIAVNLNTDTIGKSSKFSHPAPPLATDELTYADALAANATGGGVLKTLKRQIFGDDTQIPGVTSVLVESFNIMLDRISRSRLAGDPPDHAIGPLLGDVNLFDFHRANDAIERGYEAASKSVGDIKMIASSLS